MSRCFCKGELRCSAGLSLQWIYPLARMALVGTVDSPITTTDTMIFTDEQEAIFQSEADTLRVRAGAGCAKTSTQVEYARRRPDKRFLYLAYNKAIQQEAASKFPSNVRCVTGHGLAYPAFGRSYSNKLGNPKPIDLTQCFGWDYLSSGAVLNIVKAFLCSADSEINEDHALAAGVRADKAGAAIDAARRVWESMMDRSHGALQMPHDGYLKLYQLTSPKLFGIDCLLCDEWQDANPAIVDIVRRQKCGKFLVGDANQSIYAWRGAVDSLDAFDVDAEYRLTTSFRFGAGVADLANRLLRDWAGETVPLHGAGPAQTQWRVDRNAPHTVLARTNCGLFDGAVEALSSPLGFGFAGGVKSYKFDMVLDGYHLYSGKLDAVRDRVMLSLKDWGALRAYADEVDDKEYKALIRVVEAYKAAIPDLVQRIKAGARGDGLGGVTLSTAHKAKGLEWDSVVLLDDFQALESKLDPATKKVIMPDRQEVNLFYVAFTRALRCLEVPLGVRKWLHEGGHADLAHQIDAAGVPDGRQAVLPVMDASPAPVGETEKVAIPVAVSRPAVTADGKWVLGWVSTNPEKARPWLNRVSEAMVSGVTLDASDRALLAKLLGEMAR